MDKEAGKKIKILFVSHSARLYGAEQSLLLFLTHMDRERFEPVVVIPEDGLLADRLCALKIKYYKIRCPWWISGRRGIFLFILKLIYNFLMEIYVTLRLTKVIYTEKPDLVYTNTMVILSGALAARLTRKPHVWHLREIVIGNQNWQSFLPKKYLFSTITKLSKIVLIVSYAVKEQFSSDGPEGKLNVVGDAVEPMQNEFPASDDQDLGLRDDDWLIAFVGSLQKLKAPDIAIKAFCDVKKKCPKTKLLIFGTGEYAYKEYLQKLVNDCLLDQDVLFLGFRSDIHNILKNCKISLLCSTMEAFPRAVIESMSAGLPVIGTNVGGIKEIIQDGVTGFLVPVNDPKSVAEKIIELYGNEELSRCMGLKGQEVISQQYGVDDYVRRIEKECLLAIAGKPDARL
ncbi:MAG: glycosyltransferase family 4 protein [Candidatus Omnitrophota bacterium]